MLHGPPGLTELAWQALCLHHQKYVPRATIISFLPTAWDVSTSVHRSQLCSRLYAGCVPQITLHETTACMSVGVTCPLNHVSAAQRAQLCVVRNGYRVLCVARTLGSGDIVHLPTWQGFSSFFFFPFLTIPTGYGSSWAGTQPETELRPTPQLQQHRILYPLCRARDPTGASRETSRVMNPLHHSGNSSFCLLIRRQTLHVFSGGNKNSQC